MREQSSASCHACTPVAGAKDEKCTGFWHGHCLLLKVQLRKWSWAGAHRHFGLLLILFSCKKNSTILNNSTTPTCFTTCCLLADTFLLTEIKMSVVSLKTKGTNGHSALSLWAAGVHLCYRLFRQKST